MASIIKVDELTTLTGTGTLNIPVGLSVAGAFSSSSRLKIPVWTTATRPSSPEVGLIGFNSDDDVKTVEVYDGTDWVIVGKAAKPNLPTGYVLAMTMDAADGGRLSGSTWTISQPAGTAATFVSSGGAGDSGYFSNSGRPAGSPPGVSNYFYRIDQMPIIGTTTDLSFCIWYKGTQSIAPQTYGPAVPLFGDIRGSVYGGLGMSNGYAEFRDSGNAYQGPQINTGTWKHVVFTMTTGKTLKIYVDGALTNTFTGVSVNTTYTRCSDIGAHYPYSGYTAPSAIDNPVVYNRILTDAEVLQVYQAQNFSV